MITGISKAVLTLEFYNNDLFIFLNFLKNQKTKFEDVIKSGMLILMQNKFENLKSLAMSEKDLKINDTLIVKNFRDLGGLAINALKLLENGDI